MSSIVFNVWCYPANGPERWTNYGQGPGSVRRLTYQEAAKWVKEITPHPRCEVREVLADGSRGRFFETDPNCPQCGNLHP
jgi:hypothetical protein